MPHDLPSPPPPVAYRGFRDRFGLAHVRKAPGDGEERALEPRFDLANLNPDGFDYGNGGRGCAQLALALLADAFGPGRAGGQLALAFCRDVKWQVLSVLAPDAGWHLGQTGLLAEVGRIAAEDPNGSSAKVQRARDAVATQEEQAYLMRLLGTSELARLGLIEPVRDDFDSYEEVQAHYRGIADEGLWQVLCGKLRLSAAFAGRLLGTRPPPRPAPGQPAAR